MSIRVTSNASLIIATFKRFPQDFDRGVRRTLQAGGNEIQAEMIRASTTKLKRRSGTLARGWTNRVEGHGMGLRLIILNETPYAVTHEFGAVITPKRRKFLAIPIGDAVTAAGVARISPSDIKGRSFIAKDVIFEKHNGSYSPMFALKREVRIPARLGARDIFDRQAKRVEKRVMDEVARIWNQQR